MSCCTVVLPSTVSQHCSFIRPETSVTGNNCSYEPILACHRGCVRLYRINPSARCRLSLLTNAGIQGNVPSLLFRISILVVVRVDSREQLQVGRFPGAFACCCLRHQDIIPSFATLLFRSTRNQHGNCKPILATVRLYSILQLAVFVWRPRTHTLIHSVDVGNQDIMPSALTLTSCSTRYQRGNCNPILVTVRLYRLLQLAVFVCCPFTRTFILPVDAGIQDIAPSVATLISRST
jgi:hypothetical protein